jgi:hypothetical protein
MRTTIPAGPIGLIHNVNGDSVDANGNVVGVVLRCFFIHLCISGVMRVTRLALKAGVERFNGEVPSQRTDFPKYVEHGLFQAGLDDGAHRSLCDRTLPFSIFDNNY